MLERNEKGFTLIEIIVSTAIASIVIAVTLSMILTSFDLFGNLSTTKLKKDSLDNIESYVRSQVLNAGTIVISSKKPAGDDWKWLYVDHDMLYRGDKNNEDGKPVLDVSYYNKKSLDDTNKKANVLKMSVTAYRSNAESSEESEFRAKFSYVFSNSDEKYTKGDTVKFSNVKSLKDGETSPYNGDIRSLGIGKDSTSILSSTMKLYYKGAGSSSSSGDNNNNQKGSYTGTVADKLTFMSSYLNRGYYVTGTSNNDDELFKIPSNNTYRLGDFTYYQGYWWIKITNDDINSYNPPENGSSTWQRIDKNYINENTYLKGDVVLYNNYYYKCNYDKTSYNPPDEWNSTNYRGNGNQKENSRWICLGKENEIDLSTPGFDTTFANLGNGQLSNLFNLQAPKSSPINDNARTSLPNYKIYSHKYEGVPIYDENATVTKDSETNVNVYNKNTFNTDNFNVGGLIQVKVANSGESGGNKDCYYRLYKKIYEPDATTNKGELVPGGSFMSGWKLLENEYMPNSSYEAGDSVRIGTSSLNADGNEKNYIQFLSNGKISEKLNVNYYSVYKEIIDHYRWKETKYDFKDESASYSSNVSMLGTKDSYEYLACKFNLYDPTLIEAKNGKVSTIGYYTNYDGKSTQYWIKRAMIYNSLTTNATTKSIQVTKQVDDNNTVRKDINVTVDNDAMMNTYWTRKSVNELNNG